MTWKQLIFFLRETKKLVKLVVELHASLAAAGKCRKIRIDAIKKKQDENLSLSICSTEHRIA